jgi:adenosyl cobinamide kinase/adenosyl cobinamide phosphate guanylyltransferase
MPLVFLLGGARSGKSALALEIARATARPVTLLATAEARDDEMRDRIAKHRAQRPPEWTVVEEPVELSRSLAAAAEDSTIVVDCISLWVANLFERGWTEEALVREADSAARLAAGRTGTTIAVSNEVGLGIVPVNAVARAYRDALGRVNAAWAAVAGEAALVVAGRALTLAAAETLVPRPKEAR